MKLNKIALRFVGWSQVFKGQKLFCTVRVYSTRSAQKNSESLPNWLAKLCVFVRDDIIYPNFTFYFPFQTFRLMCNFFTASKPHEALFEAIDSDGWCAVRWNTFPIMQFLRYCPFVHCFSKTTQMKTRTRTKVSLLRWRHTAHAENCRGTVSIQFGV